MTYSQYAKRFRIVCEIGQGVIALPDEVVGFQVRPLSRAFHGILKNGAGTRILFSTCITSGRIFFA